MSDASSYWSPVCALVCRLRCWVRMASSSDGAPYEGAWSQLLIMPVEGYLESGEGPLPFRQIEWVELSTAIVRGGMAGRTREMVDIKDDLVSALRETHVTWELRDGSWLLERSFDAEPVQLIRLENPFR